MTPPGQAPLTLLGRTARGGFLRINDQLAADLDEFQYWLVSQLMFERTIVVRLRVVSTFLRELRTCDVAPTTVAQARRR